MNLDYIGKTIIGAVAQRPFRDRNDSFNFCKLIPLFNHREEGEEIYLSPNDFYNDHEIWWRLVSYPTQIIPGMLMEFSLEKAPLGKEDDPESSLYQANFDGSEQVLGPKSGAEVFTLADQTENSLYKTVRDGAELTLPHVPSRVVYFRVRGSVYGPFVADWRRAQEDCQAKVLAKTILNGKVYKISDRDFSRTYKRAVVNSVLSTSQIKRSHSNQTVSITWEYLSPDECTRIENTRSEYWQEVDFEPLAQKIISLGGLAKGFTRGEKSKIKEYLDRLEEAETRVANPSEFRAAVERARHTSENIERNIDELVKVLLEYGFLNEDRLEKAQEAYLTEWIEGQTEKIDQAIEEKQRELDGIRQEADKAKAEFTLQAKRREKELQVRMERRREELAKMEAEKLGEIQKERDRWDMEMEQRRRDSDQQKHAIEEMLAAIQTSTKAQAEDVIRLYPFLEKLFQPGKAPEPPVQVSTPATHNKSEPFAFPTLLKSACKGARKPVSQGLFLAELEKKTQAEGLYYTKSDLRRFHTSVLCEGLTVLGGASGVGKSSLARIYGEILSGGEAAPRDGTHIIHVSPTWIERADILGYVNTVTGEFSPSESGLYQRLIYASEDYRSNGGDSALYPICLDEMNLSQVEHYFSDFMQLLELPEKNRILPCFAPEAVAPDAVFKNFSQVHLSPSLRFIGTVNFDETTKRMSMRLLDRVNLVQLTETATAPLSRSETDGDSFPGVSLATYLSWIKTENLSSKAQECLKALEPPLKTLGVTISPRVREGMKRYIATSKDVIDPNPEVGERIAFDEQIAQRVLSKVRFVMSKAQDEALDQILSVLRPYCGESIAQSKRLINELKNQPRSFQYQREEDEI